MRDTHGAHSFGARMEVAPSSTQSEPPPPSGNTSFLTQPVAHPPTHPPTHPHTHTHTRYTPETGTYNGAECSRQASRQAKKTHDHRRRGTFRKKNRHQGRNTHRHTHTEGEREREFQTQRYLGRALLVPRGNNAGWGQILDDGPYAASFCLCSTPMPPHRSSLFSCHIHRSPQFLGSLCY